jgi:hypothetical protein
MRNWNQQEKQLLLEGSFNDVMHHRLYFGRNDAGASLIPAEPFRIFTNGVGQIESNISTGAQVTLRECDTSQDGRGGTIPNGQAFVCVSIGIRVSVSNVQATTPFTDNSVTAIDVTPVWVANPIPLVHAISSQCTFELWKNSDIRLERGNIDEYPCQFGLQGFSGGGQDVGDTSEAVTFMSTNGLMVRPLTVYQVLESLDEFYGVFQAQRPIELEDTLLTGHIDFYLIGMLATRDQSRQYVTTF